MLAEIRGGACKMPGELPQGCQGPGPPTTYVSNNKTRSKVGVQFRKELQHQSSAKTKSLSYFKRVFD